MSKRIIKKNVKKIAKTNSKNNSNKKLLNVNITKHNIIYTKVKCMVCATVLNMDLLEYLTKDNEYYVPICLFCHPITTKKNVVVADNDRIKRFIDKCKQQGE